MLITLFNMLIFMGFDGYNFDFENIDYADRDRLTAFVAYLSKPFTPIQY